MSDGKAHRVLRIAHRGASGTRPENTLAAFRRAIELGADMIELDCQLTRDGALIVIHDDSLERTTSGHGRVREAGLEEIRSLDAGAWFGPEYTGLQVPLLDEVLDLLAETCQVNVELKGDDGDGELQRGALDRVRRRGLVGRTVFSSFSRGTMLRLRAMAPDVRTAVLVGDGADWTAALGHARKLSAEAVHPEISVVHAERVAAAHAQGFEVRVWPVNERADIVALVAMGVDGIFTDYPERVPG